MSTFRILAHRGLVSDFVPENTTKAFADALHAGADVLETDVQCTKDGVPIIFHDADLIRLAGIPKKIVDLTWKEISVVDIGFGKRIPSLKEALLDFPNAKFNLDIKSDSAAVPVARLISELAAENRVLISSFSDARRKMALTQIPDSVKTSAGTKTALLLWLASKLGSAPLFRYFSRGIDALQVPVSSKGLRFDSRRLIHLCQQANLEIHFWTVNDTAEALRLKLLGANGVVTDRCDEMVIALKNN